jgi:ferredoxin-NADP reductase
MSPIVFVVGGVVALGLLIFVLRGNSSGAARALPASAMNWSVTTVTPETPSAVSFEVDATLAFKAGQFVLVRPNAELPWRAYSFSRAPGAPLRLTVKRVPDGKVSTHLTTQLKTGDRLEVKGPYGHFLVPSSFTRALFVAGGSGITPFLSQLHEQATLGWPRSITLVYANRSRAETILRAEVEALLADANGKLEVVWVSDDESEPLRGPLSKAVLASALEGRAPFDFIATCGPQPMMDNVRELATEKYPGVHVLEEKFSAAPEASATGPAHQVEVVIDGAPRAFTVKEGEHVLTAARTAGIGLSAGCEMGACGVCRVRMVDGTIDVPSDSCLSDDEKAQGYALVCVGTVKANCRFEPAP